MRAILLTILAMYGLFVSSTSFACNYWDRRDGSCGASWAKEDAPIESVDRGYFWAD